MRVEGNFAHWGSVESQRDRGACEVGKSTQRGECWPGSSGWFVHPHATRGAQRAIAISEQRKQYEVQLSFRRSIQSRCVLKMDRGGLRSQGTQRLLQASYSDLGHFQHADCCHSEARGLSNHNHSGLFIFRGQKKEVAFIMLLFLVHIQC